MNTHTPMRIAHLTSVHPRYDTRIFLKQCRSLANAGFSVSLIVADGKGNEIISNISIFDVGKPKSRLDRMLLITRRIWSKANKLDCDIYHLHDPELIPIGLKLKKRGKKVIFDSHEDVPKQILDKHYLYPFFRKMVSTFYDFYERCVLKKYDLIITADQFVCDKYTVLHPLVMNINNYPVKEDFGKGNKPYQERPMRIAYVGGITAIRGIREMVKAMEYCNKDVSLHIAGKFESSVLRKEVTQYHGWDKVKELGYLDRKQVSSLLAQSRAGLVLLHPSKNYVDALPVKMFEYMSAGIPVISSNFSLWREIVEGNGCGICVDPKDHKEIAEAIDWIIEHPEDAEKMGRMGRKAVNEKYNWEKEKKKLIEAYSSMFG